MRNEITREELEGMKGDPGRRYGCVRGGSELILSESVRNLADALDLKSGEIFEQFRDASLIVGLRTNGTRVPFYGLEWLETALELQTLPAGKHALVVPYDDSERCDDVDVLCALCIAFKGGHCYE